MNSLPLPLSGRLRVAARVVRMLGLLAVCVPGYYLRRALGGDNPWPQRFLGGVARAAGLKVTLVGEAPKAGAILLANHVSWMDIPALAGATGTAFVAHDGLAGVSLLRWLCEMNDTVFIARHRRASIAEQVGQVRAALSGARPLTLFPEGTTSDGTGLLPLKSSLLAAFEDLPAGTHVHPVLLDYGPCSAEVSWVGDDPGPANFKRILARRKPIVLAIRVLPALSGEDVADRKAMAAATRTALLGGLRDQRVAL